MGGHSRRRSARLARPGCNRQAALILLAGGQGNVSSGPRGKTLPILKTARGHSVERTSAHKCGKRRAGKWREYLNGAVRFDECYAIGTEVPLQEHRGRRMLPLYAARIEDLGRGDLVKVDCASCQHVAVLTPEALLRLGLGGYNISKIKLRTMFRPRPVYGGYC